jgi:hypothetical protein
MTHHTYNDLRDSIRATGRYDLRLIMLLAAERTRAELLAFERMGIRRTYRQEIIYSLRIIWMAAKSSMDGDHTDRMRAEANTIVLQHAA